MALEWLQIGDFRCIEQLQIEPHPDCTIITGENASGKTSFLEAIYVLGRGRSFRTAYREHLIRDGSKSFSVVGRASAADTLGTRAVTLGISADRNATQSKIDGVKVSSLADLAAALPVQIIDPEIHKLVEEGPSRRRRFLDWGVFHVEHRFLEHWRRYQRALRQRNAALRRHQNRAALSGFEQELITEGQAITELRKSYISSLQPLIDPIVADLLDIELELEYAPGWPAGQNLAQALDQSWERDRRQQATHPGPHRADLHIQFSGKRAKARVSRGQQKLLAAALVLAQSEHLQLAMDENATTGSTTAANHPGVLLIDDPGAELDQQRLDKLLGRLKSNRAQLFITALDERSLVAISDAGHYHIDQGNLRKMV